MAKRTILLILSCNAMVAGKTNVLTANYGNERSNANLQETVLTTANVGPVNFAKLGSFPVDGQIYAQPLYVNQLFISGRGTYNVIYTATQHNSVYAYDADIPSAAGLLWQVNLGQPFPVAQLQSANVHPFVSLGGHFKQFFSQLERPLARYLCGPHVPSIGAHGVNVLS